MKITYAQVTPIYDGFISLGESKISGWAKNLKNIMTLRELDKKAKERQRQVVEKFAKKDKKGNYIIEEKNGIQRNVYTPSNGKAAQKALNELMQEEVGVTLLVLDKNDMLDDKKKNVALKGFEMMPLYEKKLIPND